MGGGPKEGPKNLCGIKLLPERIYESEYGKLTFKEATIPDMYDEKTLVCCSSKLRRLKEFIKSRDLMGFCDATHWLNLEPGPLYGAVRMSSLSALCRMFEEDLFDSKKWGEFCRKRFGDDCQDYFVPLNDKGLGKRRMLAILSGDETGEILAEAILYNGSAVSPLLVRGAIVYELELYKRMDEGIHYDAEFKYK